MHVTVLMAVYNGESTVQKAVESVLAQKYTDWDLIIVDDGSTDNSYQVISAIAKQDNRIQIIRNAHNLGFPASLNFGWQSSKSDLIALNDADDTSHPDRLAHQVSFMNAHPEIDVLGAGVVLLDQDGATISTAMRPENHDELESRMYKENPFFHPTVMYRRRFLEALNGYDPMLKRSQDVDLFLRGYRKFRYHNLQEVLVSYRTRPRPSLKSIFFGSFVLLRASWREHRIISKGWYAFRFLICNLLYWMRLARPRLLTSPQKQTIGVH